MASSPEAENPPAHPVRPSLLSTPPKGKKDGTGIHNTPIVVKYAGQGSNSVSQQTEKRDGRLIQMKEEITGKIVGPMPPQLFLDKWSGLPKANVEINPSDLTRFRTSIRQLASFTLEEGMYPAFVESVQPICPLLHLRNTSFKPMKAFHKVLIKPDVCVYADIDDLELNDPTRPEIMMEFKVGNDSDPFIDDIFKKTLLRDTAEASETLGQITTYAAAHQAAQFRTHVFSLLVLPTYCRLLRWDRSGVVVTEKIPLTNLILPEFLHRYSHATLQQRGVDTSVCTPSPVDASAAREALKLPANAVLLQASVSPNKGGYIFSRTTYMNATKSPLGRSTRSYLAYSIDDDAVVFLKDAWRLGLQTPEHEIYEELKKEGVPYVATVIDGADIMDHATKTQELIGEKPSWAVDLPKGLRKHMHYRLVLKEVASHLTTFTSTKMLVNVVRQALIAHQKAHKAGILHRDISTNNIMIYNGEALLIDWDLSKRTQGNKEAREIERTGTWQFIAARLLMETAEVEGPHNITDDLESFVHLLTWMAFNYTAHTMPLKPLTRFLSNTYDSSYVAPDGKTFGGIEKCGYLISGVELRRTRFESKNLKDLLISLTQKISLRYKGPPTLESLYVCEDDPAGPLILSRAVSNYQTSLENLSASTWMIRIIDEHLEKGGWPEDDTVVERNLVWQPGSTTDDQSVSSQRRTRGSTATEGSRKRPRLSASHTASLKSVMES